MSECDCSERVEELKERNELLEENLNLRRELAQYHTAVISQLQQQVDVFTRRQNETGADEGE